MLGRVLWSKLIVDFAFIIVVGLCLGHDEQKGVLLYSSKASVMLGTCSLATPVKSTAEDQIYEMQVAPYITMYFRTNLPASVPIDHR